MALRGPEHGLPSLLTFMQMGSWKGEKEAGENIVWLKIVDESPEVNLQGLRTAEGRREMTRI